MFYGLFNGFFSLKRRGCVILYGPSSGRRKGGVSGCNYGCNGRYYNCVNGQVSVWGSLERCLVKCTVYAVYDRTTGGQASGQLCRGQRGISFGLDHLGGYCVIVCRRGRVTRGNACSHSISVSK